MSSGIRKSLITLAVSSAILSPSVFATNGYFAHGYSTKEKGLAGAGAAYSQDSLAAATNPAGMVNVGERMDVGAALFNPNRGYTSTGAAATPPGCGLGCPFNIDAGSVDSDSNYFLIPHFGYNWMLDSNSSAGISVYGNGGMNTNYKQGSATITPDGGTTWFPNVPGVFGAGTAGVNLAQLFISGTYAKKLNDDHSVGASLVFAYQQFKADGLTNFGGFSTDPSKLSNNGDDTSTGFGAKIGWQGKVAPGLALGASYQTKMSMSEFDKYAGLFAESGDFDIPATLIVGAAFDIDDKRKLVVDIQSIYYSDVAAIGTGISPLQTACTPSGTGGTGSGCLGGSGGAGFGWEDMTVIKLGYQWIQNDMTWRVGLSHGSQPIPETEVMFNILAPGVMETHLTFGFTMPMATDTEFNFSAMYAPSNSVSGQNAFGPQTIELEMDQFELQATYSKKF